MHVRLPLISLLISNGRVKQRTKQFTIYW